MLKKTELVGISAHWIRNLPIGKKFKPADLYIFLELNHAVKIERRGDAETEPRYKNDARWAILEAFNGGVVMRRARGVYERVDPLEGIVL